MGKCLKWDAWPHRVGDSEQHYFFLDPCFMVSEFPWLKISGSRNALAIFLWIRYFTEPWGGASEPFSIWKIFDLSYEQKCNSYFFWVSLPLWVLFGGFWRAWVVFLFFLNFIILLISSSITGIKRDFSVWVGQKEWWEALSSQLTHLSE